MKTAAVIKKVLIALLTALFVAFAAFSLLYFSPGDPAELLLMEKTGGSGLQLDVVREYAEKLGTNQGLLPMFENWFWKMLQFDLGRSYRTGRPVWYEFETRFMTSVSLALMSGAISLVVGITLGMLSAKYKNKFIDKISRFISAVNMSVPSFWLAIVAMWLFAMKLKIAPISGDLGIRSLILPSIVLGVTGCSGLIRITRICILENLNEEYVLTLKAKGLSALAIFKKHILKNISLPIITMATSNIISLISGSIIIENIFGLPGIGNYLIKSIQLKDFPVILGFVFIMSLTVVILNLISELIGYALDPRIRMEIYGK